MKTTTESSGINPWSLFAQLLFNPFVLLTLVAVIALTITSHSTQNNSVRTILNVLAMLGMSILGSMLYAKWHSYAETGKLIEKGKSSIRNLKLTQNELGSLQARVVDFLADQKHDGQSKLLGTNLEEIIRNIISIREQTIVSIENWKDVFPEADIKSQIGIYSDKKHRLHEIEEEKKRIEAELNETKKGQITDKSQIVKLRKELIDKTIKLERVREERDQARNSLDVGLLSGLNLASGSSVFSGTTTASLPRIDVPGQPMILKLASRFGAIIMSYGEDDTTISLEILKGTLAKKHQGVLHSMAAQIRRTLQIVEVEAEKAGPVRTSNE